MWASTVIRSASPDDCPAVAQVHVASWQAAYAGILDPAFLAGLSVERREASWRQVLASFGRSRDADAPPGRGELMALYVHPASWSTGVGRALWLAAHATLQARGCSSVSLWVLERNARAIRFYSAAGFMVEAESQQELELGGTKVRELRMVHAS